MRALQGGSTALPGAATGEGASLSPEATEARRELQRRAILRRGGGLYAFFRLAWEHFKPTPFRDGKHLRLIALHLEAVTFGEIDRLIINQPPGTSKSSLVSVCWPIWEWLFFPSHHFMFATFDDSLANRDSEASRELLNSLWFRSLFGDLCGHETGACNHPRLCQSQTKSDTVGVWYNDGGGFRFSTTVESKATGWHAHRQVVDDPTKPNSVLGGATEATNALKRVATWYSGTMATRKADPENFARVILMQRLHEMDLSGVSIDSGGWVHLCLPMEYDPARHCKTPIGEDWRTIPGEPLCPDRFDAEAIAELKKDMGPVIYESQCQQNPVKPGGEIIADDWIRELDFSPEALFARGAEGIISIDSNFGDGRQVDRVSIQLWLKLELDFFCADALFDTFSFTETLAACETFFSRYPQVSARIIEKKANGTAIVSMYETRVSGLVYAEPVAEKATRVISVSPVFKAGRVFIRQGQAWTGEVKSEWSGFPKKRFDDNVDSMTQALAYWLREDSSWSQYMGEVVKYLFPQRKGIR